MENDAAPTPWKITGSSIVDADGRLVCVLAGRLLKECRWTYLLASAPDLYELLCKLDEYLQAVLPAALPDQALLDEMQAVFDKFAEPE